jgi:hypothetical protein
LIDPAAKSDGHYYLSPEERIPFPWLGDELSHFQKKGNEKDYGYLVELPGGNDCQMLARCRLMQDISGKYPDS